jgi:hypothetical protein
MVLLMAFQEMAEQLSRELGISTPLWDRQKTGDLAINPSIVLTIRDLPPGFCFFSPLCECQTRRREDLLIRLMQANFLGQGTGGARIGLDVNEKLLTLSAGFPYEMNYAHFRENVEDFVNYVVYWREEIAKFDQET